MLNIFRVLSQSLCTPKISFRPTLLYFACNLSNQFYRKLIFLCQYFHRDNFMKSRFKNRSQLGPHKVSLLIEFRYYDNPFKC